jgi:hypothetical protein
LSYSLTYHQASFPTTIDFSTDAFKMLASWFASVYLPSFNELLHPRAKPEADVTDIGATTSPKKGKKGKKNAATPRKVATTAKKKADERAKVMSPRKSRAKAGAGVQRVAGDGVVEHLPIVEASAATTTLPSFPLNPTRRKTAAQKTHQPLNSNATAQPRASNSSESIPSVVSDAAPVKKRRASTPRKRLVDDENEDDFESSKPKAKKRKQSGKKKSSPSSTDDEDNETPVDFDLAASDLLPRTRSMRQADPSKRKKYIEDEDGDAIGDLLMDLLPQSEKSRKPIERATPIRNAKANNNNSNNSNNSRSNLSSTVFEKSNRIAPLPTRKEKKVSETDSAPSAPVASQTVKSSASQSSFFASYISSIALSGDGVVDEGVAQSDKIAAEDEDKASNNNVRRAIVAARGSDSFDSDDFDDDAASNLLFANISGKK